VKAGESQPLREKREGGKKERRLDLEKKIRWREKEREEGG